MKNGSLNTSKKKNPKSDLFFNNHNDYTKCDSHVHFWKTRKLLRPPLENFPSPVIKAAKKLEAAALELL